MTRVWGVHMPAEVGNGPIEGGYVSLGWPEMGDIFALPNSREAFKERLAATHPDTKAGAIPVDAGTLYKFVHEVQAGDYIVYPSKSDRMVNIGQATGKKWHSTADTPTAAEFPNHLAVKWLKHCARDEFSQPARYEIGSFITLFQVRKSAAEFLAKVGETPVATTQSVDDDPAVPSDIEAQSASQVAEESAADFIIRRLHTDLTGYDFEHFVAHLMECMGYTARVSQKSSDGGVDIIAHIDRLGFQPPIVKIQCKRQKDPIGEPVVSQLLGTLGDGEFAMFVTLGAYSPAAKMRERNTPKLRLIGGKELVEMVQDCYPQMAPQYRRVVPLRQIYVPDIAGE